MLETDTRLLIYATQKALRTVRLQM
jgi:hypothetical protein